MKLNFTRALAVLTTVILFSAACKKDARLAAVSTTTPVDYKSLSSQVAQAFYKSITGQYGGTDVTKGISLPSNINVSSRAGLRINSTSLCGFIVDTTFNTKTTAGDTAKTFFGNFHFTYTCSTTTPDGYAVHDSLMNTQVGPSFNNTTIVAQDYVVKALDNTYKVVSMNGTIRNSIQNFTKDPTKAIGNTGFFTLSTNYTLTALVVNFTSGTADITSGMSTFTTIGYQQDATTPIDGMPVDGEKGTITFIGNYMAKLVLASTPKVAYYLVNLQTGAVTAVSA